MLRYKSMNPYDNLSYVHVDRWASYWHQIKAVKVLEPKTILEVGVGNHIVYDYFKNRGFAITSLDIDPLTKPDVLGSVEKIPFEDGRFDVVLCAEVLEHLQFEQFQANLKELARVSKKHVILTLPHWGRHFSFDVRLPLVKRIRGQFKISFPSKKQHADSPHVWEIGKKGTSLDIVRRAIVGVGFSIEKDYVLFEMPYHHLFVLKKAK